MPQVLRHALAIVGPALVAGAIAMARPAAAQYAAGANVGLSVVPITTGSVRLTADAGVGRNMSWSAPRTLLSLGMTAVAGTDANGGSLGLSAQRTAEADSLAPVFSLQASAWHTVGPITLHLGLVEHALRFTGQSGGLNLQVDTEFVTDSGIVPYPSGSGTGGGTSPSTGGSQHPTLSSSVRIWSELEAGADWGVGRVRLNALVGARPSVGSFPAAAWAQAGGSIDVSHGFGLEFAAGTSPARIGLGIPSSRFVSVGLRLQPIHTSPAAHVKPPAPIAAFMVHPEGDHRFTLTYAAAQPGLVQLSGDFNEWTPVNLTEDGHGRWRATITLAPGVHHVSLRVDNGPWFAPPGIPAVPDDFGGSTGIIDVP